MSDEAKKHAWYLVLCAVSVLLVFWLIGMASTQAYEPERRESAREQATRDVQELRARLRERRDYVAEADARARASLVAAALRATQERSNRQAELAKLTQAMRTFLDRLGAPPSLADRLDVEDFAALLQRVSEARARSGAWLPLGRAKAPYFLAAVAYHESSWRWQDVNLRGSRGERCAFQVSESAAHIAGFSPRQVATSPETCVNAAIRVMEICHDRCGDTPAERWMACYATAGQCGGADDVVAQRFATARLLLGTP